MSSKILSKWYEDTKDNNFCCIRFLNGDKLCCHVNNLKWVKLVDALRNPDWVVDWDIDLTKKEKKLVLDNMQNFASLFEEYLINKLS